MAQNRKSKYKAGNVCLDNDECPNNPDLFLLRDAAADERQAILNYLNAAQDNCLADLFLAIANDEMEHYMELMGHIVRLDPIQNEMFQDVNLSIPQLRRPSKLSPKQWNYLASQAKPQMDEEDSRVSLPPERSMPAICHLTNALIDELETVNKYQRYMNEACDPAVKELFCRLMNEEKEHVAVFTAALFDLTGEPA